jgi:hypothetical protein
LPLLPDDFDQHPFPAPPVELAVEDLLPRTEIKPAVGHRDQRCASRPITRNTRSCVPLQVRIGIPVPASGTRVLARAVVQPASGPAASLMKMRDVMFMTLTRVNALFIIYH